MTNEEPTSGMEKNQGEGNREADRRYRKGTEDFSQSHDTEKLGEKARESLEGDQSEELKKAEKEGKEKAKEFDPQVKRS